MWRKDSEGKPSSSPATDLARPTSSTTITPGATPNCSPSTGNFSGETTRISAGLRVKGDVHGKSDIYIDGELEGKIQLPHSVITIGSKGHVTADLNARQIVVQGQVQGKLDAADMVRLEKSSQVSGSVTAKRIVIEDGARFKGKIEMIRAPEKPAAERAQVDAPTDELQPVAAPAAIDLEQE
ncbi:MAG: bactofilin family protein [Candidatus Acidiferrales bacterium]